MASKTPKTRKQLQTIKALIHRRFIQLYNEQRAMAVRVAQLDNRHRDMEKHLLPPEPSGIAGQLAQGLRQMTGTPTPTLYSLAESAQREVTTTLPEQLRQLRNAVNRLSERADTTAGTLKDRESLAKMLPELQSITNNSSRQTAELIQLSHRMDKFAGWGRDLATEIRQYNTRRQEDSQGVTDQLHALTRQVRQLEEAMPKHHAWAQEDTATEAVWIVRTVEKGDPWGATLGAYRNLARAEEVRKADAERHPESHAYTLRLTVED